MVDEYDGQLDSQFEFCTTFTPDDFIHGFGEVGDAVLIGVLHPKMISFLDEKWHAEGPDVVYVLITKYTTD